MNAARVILEVHDRGSVLERYVFREPRACVVGSALDCDLRISQRDAHDVSFYHCLFVINPPRIRVRDLVSREGTYVNGARIGQSLEDIDLCDMHGTDLKDGDEIRIGQTLIRVAIEPCPESDEMELTYTHHAN
jgi:pSer/pThr/pTyr-binding forkhead associated (FHA) protein